MVVERQSVVLDLVSSKYSGLLVVIALVTALIRYIPRKANLPRYGTHSGLLGSWYDSLDYLKDSAKVLSAGYEKFSRHGLFYQIRTPVRWFIVAPPKFIEEIRTAPSTHLCAREAATDILQAGYTISPVVEADKFHFHTIKSHLTPNLERMIDDIRDEISLAFDDEIGNPADWKPVVMSRAAHRIATRSANRLLVGSPLCRNDEYLQMSIKYTIDVFGGADKLRAWPAFLRTIVTRLVTEVGERQQVARKHLLPYIQERLRQQASNNEKFLQDKPMDSLQWIIDVAPPEELKNPENLMYRMLHVNVAAVHTTGLTYHNCMFDLALSTDIHAELRNEIDDAVTTLGWTGQALARMRKLDSFMLESQRLAPISSSQFTRVVKQDFTFSDGTTVPKGSYVFIPMHAMSLDDEIYPSASKFDPFRFSRLRELPGNENRYQFVTTSPTHINFGHGKDACPGRFFASQEIKLLLAHTLLNYDVRLEDPSGGVPKPSCIAQSEFIRNVSIALRTQVDRLHHFQREHLPSFQNIHDLVAIYHESNGDCHPAVSSVLLCITQLLQIFKKLEGSGHQVKNDLDITVVGLCTGSLVAAAYAASSSLEDLKVLAIPTVAMAFQIGLQAATVSEMVYKQKSSPESWSMAISKMTEVEVLSALKTCNGGGYLSLRQQCYVSAVGFNCITVSGAPPSLSCFRDHINTSRPEIKTRSLPIFAAYHSSNIHAVFDFPSLLQKCEVDPDVLASIPMRKTLLSPMTGHKVESGNALGVFETIIHHILQAPLRLDLILENITSQVKETRTLLVRIDSVGPVPVAASFAAALRSQTDVNVSTENLVSLDREAANNQPSDLSRAPLAIVGIAGRFPGAENIEQLWNVLDAGLDLHRVVPKDRFDVENHVDPEGKKKNTSWTPYGCFIDKPGDFDPRFFNMSPREALQTDPMQRLALVTAYEALEMAGYVPDRTPSTSLDRVGTFYGQTSDDYRDVNSSQDIGTYFITGGIRAFGPGRINYYFKFGGPSFSIDTACSSSLAAIHVACTSLWSGDCDTAVAGGLSVLTSPDLFSGLSRGQFLSKTGSCKTFDNEADGYCRSDGIGSVIVKRLSDAERDRDNILAVVLGAATNHSANAVSITHPHAGAQSNLFRKVVQQSGIDATDVNYVEMHGTGTQAGDGTEMRSVLDVFAPSHPARAPNNPLYVGAVKANMGHGEASSGVTALIKSIMMLKKGVIPPHVGIKNEMNKGFPDLGSRNVHIPFAKTPFQSIQGRKRTIFVNNFSAAGGNTALLIQDHPGYADRQEIQPRTLHAVTVSGHTASALKNNLERMIAYLSNNPRIMPSDLSYTTTARRRHHTLRLTATGTSIDEIKSALEIKLQKIPSSASLSEGEKSVVFVFTGQGAAYPAMAKELYTTSAQFRADIQQFDGIATEQGFPSFLPILNGEAADLNTLSPTQTQVGLMCIQVALARLWSSLGIKPKAVIGHSLGEYAALQISGVLSISDAIFLVGHRAKLLQNLCKMNTHAMLAVNRPPTILDAAPASISAGVEVACLNSPGDTVFAAEKGIIDQLQVYLSSQGARYTKLDLPYAFHSQQVNPILDELETVARSVNMGPPKITYISSLNGKPLQSSDTVDAIYIRQHCRQSVAFSTALENARSDNIIDQSTVYLEIGPHPICTGMIKASLGSDTSTFPTLRRKEDPWKVILGTLASLHDMGFAINWSEYHRDIEGSCHLLTLPSYAFDNKNYWIPYRNNWTLRKGDPASTVEVRETKQVQQAPKRLSASVHRVAREDYSLPEPSITFESDLYSPELHEAISGHRVNGSALCPSSVYGDIAVTIARHIQQNPEAGILTTGHSITDMEVTQPLIANPVKEDEHRVLRVHARVNKSSQALNLEFASFNPDQKSETKHATCTIEYGCPDKWLRGWKHDLHLVKDRISALEAQAVSGEVSKITSGLAYRLFSSLVDYAPRYQRMNNVFLAGPTFEASADVGLENRGGNDDEFVCNPYFIDALAHLSGFVMNGNFTVDYNEAVYISHGWESMRFAKPFESTGKYRTYVRMLPADKTMVSGNVWILCNDEIVGLIQGLRFQRVPRTVLDMLLPPVGRRQPVPKAPTKQLQMQTPKFQSPPRIQAVTVIGSHQKVQKESVQPSDSTIDLIAEELGLPRADISLHDKLHDLGMDSLMSLTLSGNLRERFGIDVSHSQLMDCDTIGQLLDLIHPNGQAALENISSEESSSSSTTSSEDASDSSGTITVGSEAEDTTDLIRSVIVDETGIEAKDLHPQADLGSFGVDSLMSLAILSRLRGMGVDLPMDFFMEHQTMADVSRAILGSSCPKDEPRRPEEVKFKTEQIYHGKLVVVDKDLPSAQAILLQVRSNPAGDRQLFLFPDGSGSPSSYSALAQLNPDFNVYGLVCPFLKAPEGTTSSIEDTAQIYLSTIRAHQPQGPYYLGGWSAGGVLAYEASKQLIEAGDEVSGLVLIDSPCPLSIPPMSASLIEFLDSTGTFGKMQGASSAVVSAERKRALLNHFNFTVASLGRYKPTSIPLAPAAKRIRVFIVWATEGMLEDYADGAVPPVALNAAGHWILEKRTALGSNGWEQLLPVESTVLSVPGNHFTMMASPHVRTTSQCLQNALSLFK
ncbi:hypothetical protein V494_02019 [Pseudogymnoascus sp. VKM F-4513 (FW-928)]|nr:hypothetical protein V494_02019 [Pseudogymnoascus sp. VKM F-4513 (FW-928)]